MDITQNKSFIKTEFKKTPQLFKNSEYIEGHEKYIKYTKTKEVTLP